jgi:hypothetical protein
MKYFFLICLVLKFSLTFSHKLIGIIDFFRHGARTPLTVDSQGIDMLNIKWENGKGALTNIGIRQHYLAGLNIRDKYVNDKKLFIEYYDPDEFSILSTDVDRTIVSAYSRVLGIFPLLNNNNSEFVNNNTLISPLPQIVPVRAIDYPSILFQIDDNGVCRGFDEKYFLENKDSLQFGVKTILKINYLVHKFEKSIYPLLKPKLRLSKKDLNERKIDNPRFIYHISDAILCAITDGKDISNLELSQGDLSFFKEYKDFFLVYGKRSDNHLKIMSVPIFDKIIEVTERFLSQKDKLKYVGYSIHDKNMITFFRVMKLMNEGLKEISFQFASELLIEIYDDGEMEMLFNNKSFIQINIKDFKEKRNNNLMSTKDFNDFCGFFDKNDQKYILTSEGILIFFCLLDCVLAGMIIILLKIRNSNRINNIEIKEVVLPETRLINERV